jgi:alpha-2-macroglobulin
VRWLMAVRKEGRWESTYETVWSLLGLTDWMVSTGELQGNFTYSVALNDKTLKDGTVTKDTVGQQVQLRAAVKDLLLDQSNRLVLERGAGPGRLYYTADLKYYLPADKIKALDRGIVVSRDYRLYETPDKPIGEAKVGDIIQVRLTIIAPNDLHYVILEDPLPAGCEALDTSLQTTSATIKPPELVRPDSAGAPWWRWWWDSWWSPSHTELRDEKVALFATYLSRGTYQYTYLMRASLAGKFMVIPATASEMYFPEVFGRSEGMTFTIGR